MSQQVEHKVVLGVLGGSGVYNMAGVEQVAEHQVETPFGAPSDAVAELSYQGKTFYFIPRHGKGHRHLPTEVNYRANIYALKTFGVSHLLAISAVGIMKENIKPGDMIVPDQIFDRTKGQRPSTFFGDGVVGHVTFADPFNDEMSGIIAEAALSCTDRVTKGGTYVCMEGPQFSTRAESHFYRKTLEPVAIGMTAIPEAKLAREAEMCYGMLALATDYDCWHEHEADIAVTDVMKVLKDNAELASKITQQIIAMMPATSTNEALSAARFATITDPKLIPEATRKKLDLLYGKYWS